MLYNIDFEIAAIIILILVYLVHRLQYTDMTESNRRFRVLVIGLLLATASDAITCVTISYAKLIPVWVNYLLNVVYFLCCPLCTVFVVNYIYSYFQKDGDRGLVVTWIIYGIFAVLSISSPLTHWMFYFDEDCVYRHGPLYPLLFIVPFIFVFFGLVLLITHRKLFRWKYFVCLILFVAITELGTIIQLLFLTTLLVNYFTGAISALILLFSLETPDYEKLLDTMGKLELARKEADDAKIEAYAASEAKSKFLANMSHEIRTPINGILGIDEIAIEENKDAQVQEYLLDIREAGSALLSLVNDVLDFSKIESGKMELVNEEYSLLSVVRTAQKVIEVKAREKELAFEIDVNPNMPDRLYGDEVRIRQVLMNLLSNAVKYTVAGGVYLKIDYKEGTNHQIEMHMTVRDTGIGIKEEDKASLFTAFHRLDLEKTRSIQGTGLGLRLIHDLVDMMQGTIEFESEYGVGSTFIVCIPQKVMSTITYEQACGEDRKVRVTSLEDFRAEWAKVLVVDDVDMNIKVFNGLLKKTGMEIDTATSGQECLKKQRETKYDVIFLDHMMPEMDGIETLKYMREDASSLNRQTPVVVLTANALQGAKEEYMEAGFDDYLSKPVDKENLILMCKKYLSKE